MKAAAMEIPNLKSQIQNKLQIPKTQPNRGRSIWNLEFEIWNLFGIWDLEFGVCL
jgi:hypothetical protein